MKVAFLGTPEFAVPSLATLAKRHEVALVLTQPDRPKGRGRRLAAPPVKELALALGIPILQPERLAEPEVRAALEQVRPDCLVVVAYGLKIPDWLLALPPRGTVNVHASLLPAYRGASPVNRAVMNGDAETGVTTMLMASRMDAGPILMQRRTPIGPEETAGELAARLAELGAGLLVVTLDGLVSGTVAPRAQDDARATLAPKLGKDDGRIDWRAPARSIVDLVRGVNPWPGAQTRRDGATLKVWKAAAAPGRPGAAPWTVLAASLREGLVVAAGEGAVSLLLVQAEGKKALPAPEYLLGHPLAAGTLLG
jgi:methionyl-tRNA formyltransferase